MKETGYRVVRRGVVGTAVNWRLQTPSKATEMRKEKFNRRRWHVNEAVGSHFESLEIQ